jgi:hypothetical protein
MDVIASPECSFQGEAIFFNCLGDCFVAETAPRSDILRIAGATSEKLKSTFVCDRI